MEREIEKLKKYIKENGLDKMTRKQQIVFRRYYLMTYAVRTLCMTQYEAGKLFGEWDHHNRKNKDGKINYHSRVFHGMGVYDKEKATSKFREYTVKESIEFPIGEVSAVEGIALVVQLKRHQVAKLRYIKNDQDLDETVDAIKYLIDEYNREL